MELLFNLIVYNDEEVISGHVEGVIEEARVVSTKEGTHSDLAQAFRRSDGQLNLSALERLHTLVTPERQYPGLARVGRLVRLHTNSREVAFRFAPYPGLSPIPTATLDSPSLALSLGSRWHHRSHWTVMEGDLLGAVSALPPAQQPTPDVFTLPSLPPDPKAVAAMMPFAGFDSVYLALQEVVAEVGGVCVRADNIWKHNAIIDDIVDLIARSRVIVCDVTNRNPNVFYEMGLAHMLGRQVVIITQNPADVPFDVSHLRYVHYLNNSEGIDALKDALKDRLRNLLGT